MAPFDILASLAMDIYLPVVPDMPGILATTPAIIQLTLSLYMIVLGVGQIVFGPVSDRIGRRPVVIGGALLFTAASLFMAATASAPAFLVLRLLQAIGASAALVATFATVRDVYAERPEGATIYAMFSAMLAFVPALGPIAGALLAGHFGWRAIFVTLGVLAIAASAHAMPRWRETRPVDADGQGRSFAPILRNGAFWTYTLGFSAAMVSFFVFFSTAPRVLIDRAGYSELGFSLVFATVAVMMIATTRFAKRFVALWGIAGSFARGMALLILGSVLLMVGQSMAAPSLWTFVLPMWVIAIGIVFTGSVSANGALQAFGHVAGAAVALYFCIQSLIVGVLGTLAVVFLGGDTAWPLAGYSSAMA
ncbi:MAG: CmlA/FloR family chloramphenicol efflux MFS transporter, partial [Ensifer adhaerens]